MEPITKQRDSFYSALILGIGILFIISSVIISTALLTNNNNILLIGDSREDKYRNPSVNGIRSVLNLNSEENPNSKSNLVWAKSGLRTTQIGGGYNPGSNAFYSLDDLVTLSSKRRNIIYRLGVNDIAPLSGTKLMWQVAMTNAHINILGSTATRMEYTHVGNSNEIISTQTRGFVQVTNNVNTASCSFPVAVNNWYVILIGFRASDQPNYDISISDGTITRYFNPNVVGMEPISTVLRYPVYWYAENSGTLTFTNNGVGNNVGNGIWYLGEAYKLTEKKSTFLYVGETNWNGQVGSKNYYDILSNVHTLVFNSARMPWISYKTSESINWMTETNSAGVDLGHYTNARMLANSVKRSLGI